MGDGARGFRAALEEIYPRTGVQRCWKHKAANVLDCLPRRVQPKAKGALHEIWMAATRHHQAELVLRPIHRDHTS